MGKGKGKVGKVGKVGGGGGLVDGLWCGRFGVGCSVRCASRVGECVGCFGYMLREWREARELSQVEVGRMCGLVQSTVSSLERHVNMPRLGTVYKVCVGLGVGIEEMFRFRDWVG